MPARPDTPKLAEELRLEVAGRRYRLRLDNFTAADDFAVYQKIGLSITEIFSGAISLFTIAALVWVHRRQREPDLTYEEVAKTFKFEDMQTIRRGNQAAPDREDDGVEGGDGPEA
jgi:hypothetical protein